MKRRWSTPIHVANAVVALASAAFAAAAVVEPELAQAGPAGASTSFFVLAYAVRAIPLGLAVAVLALRRPRGDLTVLLLVAGVVQLGDVGIAVAWVNPGMAVGATIGTVVPLWSAWYLRAKPRTTIRTAT